MADTVDMFLIAPQGLEKYLSYSVVLWIGKSSEINISHCWISVIHNTCTGYSACM